MFTNLSPWFEYISIMSDDFLPGTDPEKNCRVGGGDIFF